MPKLVPFITFQVSCRSPKIHAGLHKQNCGSSLGVDKYVPHAPLLAAQGVCNVEFAQTNIAVPALSVNFCQSLNVALLHSVPSCNTGFDQWYRTYTYTST
jgi:hypothetical protein